MNMLSQWIYGYRLEATFGAKKLALFYIMTGIGGNLLSAVAITESISVGASSSLFGIFALYIAFLLENFHTLPNKQGAVISIVILSIIVLGNLGSAQNKKNGGENDNVDNYAHLGN